VLPLTNIALFRPDHYSRHEVSCVAQWWNVGLWPANFSCPAVLDPQLMGATIVVKPSATGQPTDAVSKTY